MAVFGASTACGGSTHNGVGPFGSAIRRVPVASLDAGQSGRTVTMVNLAAVREEVPRATGSTGDPFLDLLVGLQDSGIGLPQTLWSFGRAFAARVTPLWRAVAIDPDRFDLLLETGIPPERLGIAFGTFDQDSVGDRLRTCEGCPQPEISAHGGVDIFTWGEPLEVDIDRRLRVPLFDELGRGGVLAITADAAVRGPSISAVEATLDGLDGRVARLAEDDPLVLVADALDEADALNAFVSDGISQQAGEPVPGEVTLLPYAAFAIGQRLENGEVTLVIALAHESSEAATGNAKRFKERVATARSALTGEFWSELFPDVQTATDGPVMLAILSGPGARIWTEFVLRADPLLLFEK